jgi:2-polyprenyl-3-methyl-5-hydroxy-6-metoxy-1,4-benzoquinol methylase
MANNALEKKQQRMRTHGWFHTTNRPGDRTLAEQLTGLDAMLDEVRGQTVLDIGCAEGLIGMECVRRGAAFVRGIERVAGHVDVANELRADMPCEFMVDDANDYDPGPRTFDIVLLLAVLHKLRAPTESCYRLAAAARDLCVIRLGPNKSESIVDARSDCVTQNIGGAMVDLGFMMEKVVLGPKGEWTWYYRRQPSAPEIG